MRTLGERLGVIHSWIGKIEQGERRLDVIEYIRVCDALGADPHEGIRLVMQKSPRSPLKKKAAGKLSV